MKEDYKNMDISQFKYTKLLNRYTAEENAYIREKNKSKKKKERISGVFRLARSKGVRKISKFIDILKGGDTYERLLAKELMLEKEYIRVSEKQRIIKEVEEYTGGGAVGDYTLDEIGEIFGLTRERVRQIEDGVLKLLKHPAVGRALREYRIKS